MRFRITVRGDSTGGHDRTELRGYLDGSIGDVNRLAVAMEPFGIVIASGADDDYDPFEDWTH